MPTLGVYSSITLNLERPNSNVVVYAKQYDIASRIIDIDLVNGSQAWDPPAGCEIVAMFDKPDGTKCIYDVVEPYPQYSAESTYSVGDRVIRTGNVYQATVDISTPEVWNTDHWSLIGPVTPAVVKLSTARMRLTLSEQALYAAGNVRAEICFYTDTQRVTSLSFLIIVEKGVPDDTTLRSSDYFNVLSETIQGLLGVSTHPPIINPNNYLWQYWDVAQNQYYDNEDDLTARGVQGERGYTGYNVGSIVRTSGTGAKGTTDTYTMYLNDSQVTPTPIQGNITVYNGQDGNASPGNVTPLMDSETPSIGTSPAFAHEDHVHPLAVTYVDIDVEITPSDGQIAYYIPTGTKETDPNVTDLFPPYSSENTYDEGDYVTYSGNVYQADDDILVPEAWNSSHWTLIGRAVTYILSAIWMYSDDIYYIARVDHVNPTISFTIEQGKTPSVTVTCTTLTSTTRNLTLRVFYI